MESLVLIFSVQLFFWGVILFVIMKSFVSIYNEIKREREAFISSLEKESHHE